MTGRESLLNLKSLEFLLTLLSNLKKLCLRWACIICKNTYKLLNSSLDILKCLNQFPNSSPSLSIASKDVSRTRENSVSWHPCLKEYKTSFKAKPQIQFSNKTNIFLTAWVRCTIRLSKNPSTQWQKQEWRKTEDARCSKPLRCCNLRKRQR